MTTIRIRAFLASLASTPFPCFFCGYWTLIILNDCLLFVIPSRVTDPTTLVLRFFFLSSFASSSFICSGDCIPLLVAKSSYICGFVYSTPTFQVPLLITFPHPISDDGYSQSQGRTLGRLYRRSTFNVHLRGLTPLFSSMNETTISLTQL